jgi:hypothetical protein
MCGSNLMIIIVVPLRLLILNKTPVCVIKQKQSSSVVMQQFDLLCIWGWRRTCPLLLIDAKQQQQRERSFDLEQKKIYNKKSAGDNYDNNHNAANKPLLFNDELRRLVSAIDSAACTNA